MPKINFPDNFLWGAATSSYQVEGSNKNNDWFIWEKDRKVAFRCGKAADSYNLFEEDFDHAKSLAHNSHRFSLEWSRIQPLQERFSKKEIKHYREVITALLERNIKPVVCLHHFTNPLWFYLNGGWLNPSSSDHFLKYVERVVSEFGSLIDYWITINEPCVYAYNSFIQGLWPPGHTSLKEAFLVLENIKKAHLKAYQVIHNAYSQAKVGIAKHMRVFSPCPYFNLGQNSFFAYVRSRLFNFDILDCLEKKKALDFIGLNYYTKDFLRTSLRNVVGKECFAAHHKLRRNFLGWYVAAEGIYKILLALKKYNLGVVITENGTCEEKGSFYEDFLRDHLFYVTKAIKAGVKVKGYFWWSLIDNFEWDKGFAPKFGLIEVDKELNRKPRNFAFVYRDICANNRLEVSSYAD
jgi:beta-glucosidase